MTRDEAIALGLVRYLPDKPCRKGHISERYTSTGNCLGCLKQTQSMVAQGRNGRAQGWPTVTTQVPNAQIPLLRDLVHLLRLQSVDGDTLRADLRDGADSLLNRARVPVVECLHVSGGFKPAPVEPYAPTPDEEAGGKPQRGAMPLPAPPASILPTLPGLDDETKRRFRLPL